MKNIAKHILFLGIQIGLGLIGLNSCKKFIEVSPPNTSITDQNVFKTDKTAASVLTNIYANISQNNTNIGFSTSFASIGLLTSLSADELTLYNLNDQRLLRYYKNALASNQNEDDHFWNKIYPIVFICNSAIEGLTNSSTLTPSVKNQLLGEAKFMRALCFFYLVNLYGDVPLPLSTDYKVNSNIPRASKAKVYEAIIADLINAQSVLNNEYQNATITSSTTERLRPNKACATALLSRVYLYNNDWTNAEISATKLLQETNLYGIVQLDDVFQKNSKETIWAIQPVGANENRNTGEGKLFILPKTGPDTYQYPVYLSENLMNDFEPGDLRKSHWTDTIEIRNINTGDLEAIYPFCYKYKIGRINTGTQEYPVLLRVAEQYLIRSEARAHQGNIQASLEDLNIIRNRAGLKSITTITQSSLLDTILHERKVELFTEWGHRWLDIKRTGKVDAVMVQVSSQKNNSVWNSNSALFPLPQSDINRNPSLTGHQNPGY